jgi:hypothetical protein
MGIEHGRLFEQATKEVPERVYEKMGARIIAAAGVTGIGATVYELVEPYKETLDNHPVITAATGVVLYGISAIADNFTTKKVVEATLEAQESGVDVETVEQNPFLHQEYASLDELKKDRNRGLTMDVINAGFSAASPLTASGILAYKGLAAANNRRLTKRLNRATEIAHSKKNHPQS